MTTLDEDINHATMSADIYLSPGPITKTQVKKFKIALDNLARKTIIQGIDAL